MDERRLRLVGIYSDPGRDPRGHSVIVAYTIMLDEQSTPRLDLMPKAQNGSLIGERSLWAFNHAEIVVDAERAFATKPA